MEYIFLALDWGGVWSVDWLKETGHKIEAFIDNAPTLVGRKIKGFSVISYDDYMKRKDGKPILVSTNLYTKEILKCYGSKNKQMMSLKAYFYLKNEEVYSRFQFADSKSSKVLDGIIQAMCLSDDSYLNKICEGNEYHALPQFYGNFVKTYIDCGAYVGDSVERFIWAHDANIERIIAFEPGKKQFGALKMRSKRLVEEWALRKEQITLVNAAVGSRTNKVTYIESTDLSGSRTDRNISDGEMVASYALDDYLEENDVVDFIKVDIEGAECEMLQGARGTICSCKPNLSVCVYHKIDDLIRVYSILKEYVPEYHFSLRHHSPKLVGTVLYAWV